MNNEKINKILSDIDFTVEDPRFYEEVFVSLGKLKTQETENLTDRVQKVLSKDYGELSLKVDQSEIQESCSVRNILKTREISTVLIDENGEFRAELLPEMIRYLKAHQYSLGPHREFDAKRNEHLVKVLTLLQENKSLVRQLKTIGKPHQHRYAEEVIKDTLELPPKTIVNDAHARRAALSAWLCYLRQNVGSCFATAPAIIVQGEQPAVFLKDVQELLGTGRLKRTFGGIEYAVPLTYSWGAGDLRRMLLFHKDDVQEDLKLWKSPALIAAFEHAGLIESSLPEAKKGEVSKNLVINVLQKWESKRPWFYASVENVLRRVLLEHKGLTEEDVHDFELRPKGMIHGGLLMTAQTSGKDKGATGKRCAEFLDTFKLAKDAFKELADNALLKTWEFTLASFSETKSQFTTWNLYSSLGLRAEDNGGIGPKLFEILKQRLDYCNTKISDIQFEYEQAYNYIQYLQRRLRQASSEEEARHVKIEYQSKSNEFYALEETRDKFHNKARRYANLYNGLIDLYFLLFPNYFQEVYDADILEVSAGPFDDSPAGFRLLYKHGRSNTSQWTPIRNHTEFVESLVSFFTATETELVNSPEMKGLEEDVGEIVTTIVSHVRSKEFLETAFWRMAQAHHSPLIKDPLDNLDKIEKKPWVYTSGGALTTLVSCYFRLEGKPTEKSRWVETPMELLVYLIDCIKELPDKTQDQLIANPEKSFLIHSPTHAFLLKPGYPHFVEAWKNKEFTYTWVRDNVFRPMESFVDRIYLDEEKMQYVIGQLMPLVPKSFQHYFGQTFARLGGSMKGTDFRDYILDTIELTRGLQSYGRGVLSKDQIDSLFYSLFPLFPSYQLKERVEVILSKLPGISTESQHQLLALLEDISGRIGSPKTISAKGLQNIIKSLIALITLDSSAPFDYPYLISQAAQQEGYAMRSPFIFADTNWVKDYFAFLVNPGSGKFELWRVDYTGSLGAPMSDWTQWLDGSKKTPDWGVYNRPHEYNLA